METAHSFGREGHLAGIVSLPEGACDTDIAVVIPNAGYIHHVGPWQLHVDLAKRLDALGVPSIRFDLSGLGDSEVPRTRETVQARNIADMRDAMDQVIKVSGARRIVMAGLCSGAVDSHRAALVEERICGVALLDPPAYQDMMFEVIYWAERLLSPPRVLRYLGRKLRKVTGLGTQQAAMPVQEPYRPMTAEVFGEQVEAATLRGVDYLFCYAGAEHYKYRRQIFSILTPATPQNRITVYHYPKLEHTPILVEDRRIIADTLAGWIQGKYL